jgi:uncharacterized damage-inducible protein DinB
MTTQRVDPPLQAGEREMLLSWLDYHRATLATKCEGLSGEKLRTAAVPPSTLSLLGLVRHMTEVERGWFRRTLRAEDAAPIYYSGENPDGDFEVRDADVADAFARWSEECDRARRIVADTSSLDVLGHHRRGDDVSLRWILVHMIEEYARHNGHADLLRERLDGSVGD